MVSHAYEDLRAWSAETENFISRSFNLWASGKRAAMKSNPRAETPEVCLSMPQLMSSSMTKIMNLLKKALGGARGEVLRWG